MKKMHSELYTNIYDEIVVGCGSRGLATLWNFKVAGKTNVIALEASARIGGTPFLISRTAPVTVACSDIFEIVRTLPELKIWWGKKWARPDEVEWDHKDWAFVAPQWKNFFQALVEIRVKTEVVDQLKSQVQLETPISEIIYTGGPTEGLWEIRSGENIFKTKIIHWTLGLKALQSCVGKKSAEDYVEKNPSFQEAARDAEGVLVCTYAGAQGDAQFVALPVRHDHKLYLTFVSLHEGNAECFTFLHDDLLTLPKDLSSFEKSIKRTLKHTLANYLPTLSTPTLGVISQAKGYSLASPWKLKNQPEKNIFFVEEESTTKNISPDLNL